MYIVVAFAFGMFFRSLGFDVLSTVLWSVLTIFCIKTALDFVSKRRD